MMDPELWKQIERLCQSAQEMEREKREAYLKKACAGDESLRKEVEALLEQQAKAEGFLKDPAIEDAAKVLAKELENALARDLIGRTIAHSCPRTKGSIGFPAWVDKTEGDSGKELHAKKHRVTDRIATLVGGTLPRTSCPLRTLELDVERREHESGAACCLTVKADLVEPHEGR